MPETYIIAIDRRSDLLVGCQPDGEQPKLGVEVDEYLGQPDNASVATDIVYEAVMLSDDEPEDESRIVWRGHDRGWLIDQDGIAYEYAIRPAA